MPAPWSCRRWRRRLAGAVLVLIAWSGVFTGVCTAQTSWREGLTRADVIRLLGQPRSTMQVGPREILNYEGDVRIEIRGGQVTAISGRVPDALRPEGAAPAAPAPSAAMPATAATPQLPATAPSTAPPAATSAPLPAATALPAAKPAVDEDAAAVNQLADPASALPTDLRSVVSPLAGSATPPAGTAGSAPAGTPALPANLGFPSDVREIELPGAATAGTVAVVVIFVVTVLAQIVILKLAFHFTGFPSLWRDLFKIALAANLLNVLISLVLGLVNQDWVLLYRVTGLGSLVNFCLLIWLILKFTDAKQFTTALGVAIAAVVIPYIGLFLGASMLASFLHWVSAR